MTASAVPSYAGCRVPAEATSRAVWLPFRFPLSLRTVDELLAARGIVVSHGWAAKRINGRQWAPRFGQAFANQVRRRLPAAGDKRHLGEVVLTIAGVKRRPPRSCSSCCCGRSRGSRPGWSGGCWRGGSESSGATGAASPHG